MRRTAELKRTAELCGLISTSPYDPDQVARDARLAEIKDEYDNGARATYLLTRQAAKTVKGEKYGILTGILYLSPADESGYNVCPYATKGCKAACLGHSSGRMRLDGAKRARILRTLEYMRDRDIFMARLKREIRKLVWLGKKKNMRVFVRLNGTSDIDWPRLFPGIFERFPTVQFYDYTKNRARMNRDNWPANYHCTFSCNEETTGADILDLTADGYNVAIVFHPDLPMQLFIPRSPRDTVYHTVNVVDGDETDARPDDNNGVVVGLKAKGAAKKDVSGFVWHNGERYE